MFIEYSVFVIASTSLLLVGAGCSKTSLAPITQNDSPASNILQVNEIAMDSFFVMENDKPAPQFSVKEITVKKGDKVRLLINAKNGKHNFNIDEFNVHSDTPTGSVTTVEFIADKLGEFVYYCAMPNHRANGHWGTLKVVE